MTDPLGLIGATDAFNRALPPLADVARNPSGPGFKEVLENQIEKVNQLQRDATAAIEDLSAGRRDDIEGVLIATEKADTAFRLLLQVRNKVLDAYDEVKQMRV
ncbi:MAG: flagellar hook-basal body complex protein FliE [Longimicrobiales bacterium]